MNDGRAIGTSILGLLERMDERDASASPATPHHEARYSRASDPVLVVPSRPARQTPPSPRLAPGAGVDASFSVPLHGIGNRAARPRGLRWESLRIIPGPENDPRPAECHPYRPPATISLDE